MCVSVKIYWVKSWVSREEECKKSKVLFVQNVDCTFIGYNPKFKKWKLRGLKKKSGPSFIRLKGDETNWDLIKFTFNSVNKKVNFEITNINQCLM